MWHCIHAGAQHVSTFSYISFYRFAVVMWAYNSCLYERDNYIFFSTILYVYMLLQTYTFVGCFVRLCWVIIYFIVSTKRDLSRAFANVRAHARASCENLAVGPGQTDYESRYRSNLWLCARLYAAHMFCVCLCVSHCVVHKIVCVRFMCVSVFRSSILCVVQESVHQII